MLRTSAARARLRRVDGYVVALFATVGLAAALPASGRPAHAVDIATQVAVGLLFFLYGARLTPQAAAAGLRHWRLHLPILLFTFAVFPLLGLAVRQLPTAVLGAELATGVLFLCLLPSTVQSAVAFTSMARGNVAAAICSASFSSLLGVFLTPLLAAWLLHGDGRGDVHFSAGHVAGIAVQLLLPFALGQAARPWAAGWVTRHRTLTTACDRGSILLVVYAAFGKGMNAGIWERVPVGRLLVLLALCGALLALVLMLTDRMGRFLGYTPKDRVTAVFCASTKSLAGGLPMATVLFAADDVGLVVLPLMLYHTIQLTACAALARRRPRVTASGDGPAAVTPPPDRAHETSPQV
ncbi:bile acid:sodium symporter family protein [Streptomyces cinnamoneus]|uniref:Bile acid:sodium symporter n=1 Tax=Streptomyces cinnamoneus TaxID=53446 RepID=A0A918U0R6_STRCJ|nr:bile acid:sodium symporter family protein [Streptomyces cinnamoneus]GHC72072.1 bile acid:sodium symporter [Streptomyces cinnamoneus]